MVRQLIYPLVAAVVLMMLPSLYGQERLVWPSGEVQEQASGVPVLQETNPGEIVIPAPGQSIETAPANTAVVEPLPEPAPVPQGSACYNCSPPVPQGAACSNCPPPVPQGTACSNCPPPVQVGTCCGQSQSHHWSWQRICAWLTYHPLPRHGFGGCAKCGVRNVSAYEFFMGRCYAPYHHHY